MFTFNLLEKAATIAVRRFNAAAAGGD